MIEKGKISKNLSIEENFFNDVPPIKLVEVPEKKIAIVGSREFTDYSIVKDIMTSFFSGVRITEIVSGGAKGADTLGKQYAIEKEISLKEFLPEWDNLSHPDAVIKEDRWGKKYDSKAGFRRNKLIVERADIIIAFWNGKSHGTKHTLEIVKKMKKWYIIYNYVTDEIYNSALNDISENYIKNLRKDL